MTIRTLQEFLMWNSIINVGLLMLSFAVLVGARGWVYRMHSKLFPITESQFNAVIYGFFGLHKVLIIVFNIIPYIAVSIVMD